MVVGVCLNLQPPIPNHYGREMIVSVCTINKGNCKLSKVVYKSSFIIFSNKLAALEGMVTVGAGMTVFLFISVTKT